MATMLIVTSMHEDVHEGTSQEHEQGKQGQQMVSVTIENNESHERDRGNHKDQAASRPLLPSIQVIRHPSFLRLKRRASPQRRSVAIRNTAYGCA